jgi:hypothetical protein
VVAVYTSRLTLPECENMVSELLEALGNLLHIRLNQYFNDVWLRDGEHYFLNSCLQTEENNLISSMLQPNCISKFNESTDLTDFRIRLKRLYFDEDIRLYYAFEWDKGYFKQIEGSQSKYIELLLYAERIRLKRDQFEYSQPDRIFLESIDWEILTPIIEEMEQRSRSWPNNSAKIRTK